jgi:hypothetical protein
VTAASLCSTPFGVIVGSTACRVRRSDLTNPRPAGSRIVSSAIAEPSARAGLTLGAGAVGMARELARLEAADPVAMYLGGRSSRRVGPTTVSKPMADFRSRRVRPLRTMGVEGLFFGAAPRRAQLKRIAAGEPPAYWAPFVLIGR